MKHRSRGQQRKKEVRVTILVKGYYTADGKRQCHIRSD